MSIDISDMFKSFFNNTNQREKSEHRAKRLKGPKIYNMLPGLINKSVLKSLTEDHWWL